MERIQEDPAAFYNPTIQRGNQTFFMATPAGITMAAELSELFMIPTNILRRNRDGAASPPRKRARTGEVVMEEGDDDEVEVGRRQQRGLSERLRGDSQPAELTFGDLDNGPEIQNENPPMDEEHLAGGEAFSVRGASVARSPAALAERAMSEVRSVRAPSLARSDMASPDDCPIGFFDTRSRSDGTNAESQSQGQAAASQYIVEDEASQADARERGFSQNTVKAVGFLRNEFSTEDGHIDEDKSISFQEKANKVCGISRLMEYEY